MKQQRQGVRSTQEKDQEEEPSDAPNEDKKKHKDVYCVYLGFQRKNIHRSNRKVSLPICWRQPVPDDYDWNWCKLYWCRAYEKQINKGKYKSLPNTSSTHQSFWSVRSKNAYFRQWGKQRISTRNQKAMQTSQWYRQTHTDAISQNEQFKHSKNHFIAILAGLDPSFPIFFWSRLVPQAVLTMNLVWPSNVVPKVSAHAYMYGHFDFNANTACTSRMSSFNYISSHTDEHLGESMRRQVGIWAQPSRHYRCHRIWNKETKAERISGHSIFQAQIHHATNTSPLRICY